MQLTRRGFLAGGVACSAAAHPWLTPMALAEVPGAEGRLVVIVLRGAMDGLDLVRPMGDPMLVHYRPDLVRGARGIDLGAGFDLHPALAGLTPLWQAGELGFAHAVSTPYRDKRSHFDGQDILEAGTPGLAEGSPAARDGWLNRLLQVLPGATGETAWTIGAETQKILSGPAAHGAWTPGARLGLSAQGQALLEMLYAHDPAFAAPAEIAFRVAGEDAGGSMGGGARSAQVEALAGFAAGRLAGEARIAAFSITGWDTHRSQSREIRRPLAALQAALLRLRDDLGPVWGRTAVLAVTEFGRTVRQNGSSGTDHGTGGAMILAGGAIRGGTVLGRWPGLAESDLYQDRDLQPTEDVRGYAAAALRGLFGVGRSVLETTVFPGLDMGAVPEVIA
jgi:uncharacterized protein (DUF1501 family)